MTPAPNLMTIFLLFIGLITLIQSEIQLQKVIYLPVFINTTGQLSASTNDLIFLDYENTSSSGRILYRYNYKTKKRSSFNDTDSITAWNELHGSRTVRYVLLAQQKNGLTSNTVRFLLYDRPGMRSLIWRQSYLEKNMIVEIAIHFAKDSFNKTDETKIKIGAVTKQGNLCTWTFDLKSQGNIDRNCTLAHAISATSIITSSDGQNWITAGSDNAIRLWKDGKAVFSWLQPKPITTLAITERQILLNGDTAGTIRAYNQTTKQVYKVPHFTYHTGAVLSLTISQNEQYMVSCGADGYIVLWDIETGKMLQKIQFDKEKMAKKVQFRITRYTPGHQNLLMQKQNYVQQQQQASKEFLYSSHANTYVHIWQITITSSGAPQLNSVHLQKSEE